MPKFLVDKISLELVEGTTQEEFQEKTYALNSDEITGVLPISKGGTGATTADGALENLNAVKKFTAVSTWSDPTYVSNGSRLLGSAFYACNYWLIAFVVKATGTQDKYLFVPVKKTVEDDVFQRQIVSTQYYIYDTSQTKATYVSIHREFTARWISTGGATIGFEPVRYCQITDDGANQEISIVNNETDGSTNHVIIPVAVYGTNV